MTTVQYLILAAGAFLVGWLGAFAIRWVAPRFGLVQVPNYRSSHTTPTPQGGGIAIAVVAVASALFAATIDGHFLLVSGLVAAFSILGLADDVLDLPPLLRFPIQIVLLALLLWWSLPLPPFVLPFGLAIKGWLLLGLLLVAGLWWINLFNFMDGIDGIAASQAIVIILGSLAIALAAEPSFLQTPLGPLGLATAAATGGFLVVNWPPARIFMGDAGSNTIALLILVFALVTVQKGLIGYLPWLILLSPFAADATVALIRRTARGERPWKAHRRHAYQQLSRQWGHARVTLLYSSFAAFVALPLAALAQQQPAFGYWLASLIYALLVALAFWAGSGDPLERT
jgi:Fuc2NAc and GlcNAc transferase